MKLPHMMSLRCLLLLAVLLLVGGCNLSKPYPAKQLYAIDVASPERSTTGSYAPAIRVQPVRVTRPFSGQVFHYRVGPARFEQDYYATWVVEPSRLITAELIDWLSATGEFEAVLDASNSVQADRSIQLTITEFYGDSSDSQDLQAVVAARLFLIDERNVESRVLLSRDYRQSEPVSGDGGDALVAAWGKALGRVFEQVTADVQGVQ